MLSYQHIFHAGNLADVQKHALLAMMLEYMVRKPKPMTYIETHSGRGLYQLDAEEAVKTGEADAGIGIAQDWFEQDHPYARALNKLRTQRGEASYPGSPAVAATVLRRDDKMHLAELHPQEAVALRQNMRGSGAKIYQQDGFELAMGLCPPTPRRGLLLIDPSYEIKDDYASIPRFIEQVHRKWNVGVIALWYPILTEARHTEMVEALKALNLPKVLRHEVSFAAAREGHRMIGSGMFIVNAPYGTEDEASRLDGLFSEHFSKRR